MVKYADDADFRDYTIAKGCRLLERWWFIPDVSGNGCIMSVEGVGTYVNRLVVRAATFGDFPGPPPQITETVARVDVTQVSFCQPLNGYSNASGTRRGLVQTPRSHLSVQFARTNYRKFSIRCRGPLVWNAIPCNIRDTQTFSRFKCLWKVHMTYEGLDT